MKNLLLTLVFVGIYTSSALADIIPPETFDLTISDTYEYGMDLNNQSLLVTGGGADQIIGLNGSYIEVQDTLPFQINVGGIGNISIADTSSLLFSGGEMNSLWLSNSATAIIEGGSIDYIDSRQILGQPHIEMIVKEHFYNTSTDILTGLWADDSAFSIELVDQTGYDPVINNITFTVVPEPATLLLFSAGAIFLRKRRK